MARCRAFVYAGLEDFGIAPVEAMASEAPVIGWGGGLLDTVRCAAAGISEPTEVLFPKQSVESLVQALEWFEQERIWRSLDAEAIRAWSERFRPEAFAARFESALRTAWSAHQGGCAVAASCLLYTSPSPRDMRRSRMPSSA